MMKHSVKVGDFVGDNCGWDTYPCLVIEICDDGIMVDEVFTRDVFGRVRKLTIWNKFSSEHQAELYEKLEKSEYYDEYKKYFRVAKINSIL